MNCPVCDNAAAEDITPHTFDGKSVRCPACGEYDIVGSVYDPGTLTHLVAFRRRAALDKATERAQPNERPRITSYDL
jgi:hypothetical protein